MAEFLLGLGAILTLGLLFGILLFLIERKRRGELAVEAARLGLEFSPGRDRGLAKRYGCLNKLAYGGDRYVDCLIHGKFRGQNVRAFDFHSREARNEGKENESADDHWLHVYTIELPDSFPELVIGPESILTRFAKNFGYPSIDFESHEFSRAFLVQSKNRKFAYDVCHPRMMEFLLENRDIYLEIDGTDMALIFDERMTPRLLERDFERLLALRELFPKYLLEG